MSTEEAVGIRAYTTTTDGFTGILRHRFTDFKVNEIDPHGKIVRLTNFDIPAPLTSNTGAAGNGEGSVDSPAAVGAAYEALLGAEAATKKDQLVEYLEKAKTHKEDPSQPAPGPLILDKMDSKDQRRAAHQLFKNLSWAPLLATEAVATEGGTDLNGIQVRIGSTKGRYTESQSGKKRKWVDPQEFSGGKLRYVKFALYKENYDTQHALTTMCKFLRLGPKTFSIAGTKDKRGVTVQWVTAYRVEPSKLVKLNSSLRGIRVGNFEFANEQLRLGDLQGNKFEILLRGLSAPSGEAVEAAAAALKQAGFINYYGLQRFGSSTVPTHAVGRCLFRGDWEGAIKNIFAPSSNPGENAGDVLEKFMAGGSADEALKVLQRSQVAERTIITVLNKEGRNSLVNALVAVPRNLRMMYTHAYQSYLWNEAASERVLEHGADKVIAGDLVIPREAMQAARMGKAGANGGGGGNGDSSSAAAASAAEVGEDVGDTDADAIIEPHVVSEEEASAGKFRIEDVVLPLPGYKVQYPDNDIAQVYKDIAARDGVDLDSSPHKVKEFSQAGMPGAYRHLLIRPGDFQYKVLKYDNRDQEFQRTDLDEINKKPAADEGKEGKYLGLQLSFSLPSSTYATMLIRELTKMQTDIEFVKSLKHPE